MRWEREMKKRTRMCLGGVVANDISKTSFVPGRTKKKVAHKRHMQFGVVQACTDYEYTHRGPCPRQRDCNNVLDAFCSKD